MADTSTAADIVPPEADDDSTDDGQDRATRSERRSQKPPPPATPQLKPKMFIAPLLLLGGKKLGIDYEVPEILLRVRCAFATVMALSLLSCALMYALVNRRKKKLSENRVEVRTKDQMNGGKEKVEILTYFDHDVREIGKAFTNQLFGFGVVAAMHIYLKVNPPLLLQTVMMPLNLWEMPVFQVHFLGRDTKSAPKLKRPWKPEEQPNPLADLAKAFTGDKTPAPDASAADSSLAAKGAPGKKGSKKAARVK
eukprot:CAMPEP_0181352622 /NCGR_PEP_ID=MMETSP1106-20121128/2408_1 /TAXON_ID=81844 /ORGANISM="Mantoniella antarctica, Strain SL-175" /LENGTH=251 /DNA_ID=CAMNT_0023465195 /DNA_START=140 /DNA_END=895 /DNA_ORIENTATION=-